MKLGRRGLSALMVGVAMTALVALTAAFAEHLKDVRGWPTIGRLRPPLSTP